MVKKRELIKAARRVIAAAGGQTQLAKAILSHRGEKLTSINILKMQRRIQKWSSVNGVAPLYAPDCEAITGIPRHEIRPDLTKLFGDVA